jgi:hypothetical protein
MRANEAERADALRKGALAELEASSDVQVRPATGAPEADGRGGGGPDVHEPTDGVGWNDSTVGSPMDEGLPPPLLLPGEQTLPSGINPEAVNLPQISVGLASTQPTASVEPEEEPTAPKMEPMTLDLDPVTIDTDAGREDMNTLDGLEVAPKRSPMLFIVLGALVPLVFALAVGGFAVVQDVGGVRTRVAALIGHGPKAPAQLPAPPPKEEVTDAMAEGGGIRFVSRWAGTAKLRVRCGEASGRGVSSAVVAADSAARCDVTAIQADRSRQIAVVNGASIGTYLCFVDGKTECTRK